MYQYHVGCGVLGFSNVYHVICRVWVLESLKQHAARREGLKEFCIYIEKENRHYSILWRISTQKTNL